MDDLALALNEVETELLETTSERKGGSDDSRYAYESEARLMDERQVLESKKILFCGAFASTNTNHSLRNSGHSTMGCE